MVVQTGDAGIVSVSGSIYFLGDDSLYHVLGIDSDGILYESGTSASTPSAALEIGNADLGPQLILGGRKLGVVLGNLTDLGTTSSPSVRRSTSLAKVSTPAADPSIYIQADSGMYHRFNVVAGFLTVSGISTEPPPAASTLALLG